MLHDRHSLVAEHGRTWKWLVVVRYSISPLGDLTWEPPGFSGYAGFMPCSHAEGAWDFRPGVDRDDGEYLSASHFTFLQIGMLLGGLFWQLGRFPQRGA